MYSQNQTSLPYSLEKVLQEINQFSVESTHGVVSTRYGEQLKRIANVTSQYKLLNIKSFFNSIIGILSDVMDIETYSFRVDRGIQEISLMSKVVLINGDEYRKAFYILNSTDRTRALRFNIGLYRVDGQRLVIPVPECITVVRFVHKGKAFETKVDNIYDFVYTFSKVVSRQIEILENLGTSKVSLRKLIGKMLFDESTDVIAGASKNRATAFCKQLRVHPTDKLNLVDYGISLSDMALLAKPTDFMLHSNADFMINAYQALQCYHSIYQGRDVGIISRESSRFMDYLEDCHMEADDKGIALAKVTVKEQARWVGSHQTAIPV